MGRPEISTKTRAVSLSSEQSDKSFQSCFRWLTQGSELLPGQVTVWCKHWLTTARPGDISGYSCTRNGWNEAKNEVRRKIPEHHCRYTHRCICTLCSSLQSPTQTPQATQRAGQKMLRYKPVLTSGPGASPKDRLQPNKLRSSTRG